jgi:hypothetical protein
MRSSPVHWNSAGNFIRQGCTRDRFGPAYRRIRRVQFAAERIVIAVFAVVGLGVRVRGCANILEIRFR